MSEQIQYIPARLKNASVGGHVAGTLDIIDDSLNNTQNNINLNFRQRLLDIEALASISYDGGQLFIATSEDFKSSDSTSRAKLPTVGAIIDGALVNKITVNNTPLLIELLPNTFYVFNEKISNITFTLATPTVDKILNEYMIEITCGSSPVLNFPSTIKWANDTPIDPEENYTYQISIVNNLAVYAEWEADIENSNLLINEDDGYYDNTESL